MSIRKRVTQLWRELFDRAGTERDLDEELGAYVDLLAQEHERAGLNPAEARRRAAAQVGSVSAVKEEVRAARAISPLEWLLRDVRLTLRGIVRRPGFALAVVLSLSLGVAGTAAIFGVIHAALLKPLPYANADRLHEVQVWWGDFSARLSRADLAALRQPGQPIDAVGGYWFPGNGFSFHAPSGVDVVRGAIVTSELPRTLGVQPTLGAGFSPEPGADAEVLISATLWRERLGGNSDVIGTRITLEGEPFTVVGVMPAGFDVPGQRNGDLWVRSNEVDPTRRGPFFFQTIVRLRAGVSDVTAARELTALATPLLRERFGVTDEWRYGLQSVRDVIVGDVRPTLRLVSLAVMLVLLIAIINIANLLLARGAERSHELAVRTALGAPRGRLVRQLLAESAVYGVAGGVLGLALAVWGLGMLARTAASFIPRIEHARLDPLLITVALGIGTLAALAAGSLPALRLSRARPFRAFRPGSRIAGRGRQVWQIRRVLVVSQIALTLTVLSGASLLAKSLMRLDSAHPGFDAAGVASFRLVLPERTYPDSATAQVAQFVSDLEARLRALPGVAQVGYGSSLPPDQLQLRNNYTIEGSAPDGRGGDGVAAWIVASPSFFTTLRIALRQGRNFGPQDHAGAPAATIVNEAFARKHFGDATSALGKRLKGGDWDPSVPWTTIVGVVADVPYDRGVWGGAEPTMYVPYAQNLWLSTPFVVVRTSQDPASLIPAARAAVLETDRDVPIRDVATMEARLRSSAAAPRFRSFLFLLLAVVAMTLSVTGVYGVLAYDVSQRRTETAVRRALGARNTQIMAGIVGSAMRMTAAGLVLGTLGAVALGRVLSGLLFAVHPLDAGAFSAAMLVLAAAALLASAIPAKRSLAADPGAVLREE